jgi:S-(hydroxymethyl)glutathione dehydrogenase/alcohol dehydrogenase
VNALQTARLAGAAQVIAVDVNPAREAVARQFGADTFLAAPREADGAAIAALVRDGAAAAIDVTIECSGAPVAIDAAIDALGPGGVAALVGIPVGGTRASFDVRRLLRQRLRVLGSLNGDCHAQRDLADIARLAADGSLDLASQVTRIWPLAEVHAAIDAVRRGAVVRAVLDHTR